MLLRLFKGNSPGVLFLIIIALIALWATAFVHPAIAASNVYETNPMPLYSLLKHVLGSNYFPGFIFSFLLVSLMAFLLVNFNTTSFFINERTYLPALMYILISGLFPQFQSLNPVLPASLFLMLAIIRIIEGYQKQGTAYNFFDAGFLISIGSLFYANLIWFGLLVIIGILMLRTVTIGEIAISVVGLGTPYFITFGLYYVIGKDPGELLSVIGDNLFVRGSGYLFPRLTIAALVLTSVIVLVSIAYLIPLLNTKKIKSRKIFSLLIWAFLISITVYLVLPSVSVEIIWITSIPVSYFLTHYFVFNKKKLIPEIFLSLLIILILLIQVSYLR